MDTPILRNKLYLYLTEFFAGVSVMAVELGASRLLAPYFSSSQIVWTIIIGTIMVAMALGNLYGGRAADRNPDPDRLYLRLLLAALWIAGIPFLGKYVILLISALLVNTVNSGFLIWAGLLSCVVIFVFPLFLLGTTTPSLARFTVQSLDDSGRTVGRLNAANTLGSILGTFLPTFVTIPALGTAVSFLIFSGVLLLIALAYFLSARRHAVRCALTLVVFLAFSLLGAQGSFAFWQKDLVYEGESVYNYLQVRDEPKQVVLSTNVLFGVQSVLPKDGGLTGLYYDYALAAPVLAGVPKAGAPKQLILGMGTGTYASQCRKYFPGLRSTGVEIDARITDLARRYFGLDPEIPVETYDGRTYLSVCGERYDVILVDAYQDITIPFQMSSVEFFTLVREHLKPGGVLVVNLNMRSDAPDSINAWLGDTVAAVFPWVATVDVPGTTNRELFAAETNLFSGFAERAAALESPELRALMIRIARELHPHESAGHVLTDDCAPVEKLGMEQLDSLIRGELAGYRVLLREQGLSALLAG